MRKLLVLGLLLFGVSAWPLALIGRELMISAMVRQRYVVERILSVEPRTGGDTLRAQIGGHEVALVDDQPVKGHVPFASYSTQITGLVSITIDGRPYSTPVQARVRIDQSDANRYWGYAYLMKLVDRNGTDRLVVAENLGKQYRTVSVFADGRVIEDTFDYRDRCSPPVRALLIRSVVPHPSGYCSDLMMVWPSLVYPMMYPFASGAVGFLCLAIVGIGALRGRRAA